MKRLLTTFFVLISISIVMAQDVIVPRTKTTTEAEFDDIKTACHEPGDLMKYYFDLLESRDEGEDVTNTRESFGSSGLIYEAFKGAVDEIDNYSNLEAATYYLQNIQNEDDKFKPQRILEYMTNTGSYAGANTGTGRRGMDIGYILHNATFIADCIWYYEDAYSVRIREQIAPIAEFGWDILKVTDADPNAPDSVILIYTGWKAHGELEYNNGQGWSREQGI